MRILVVGSGGREHSLCWAISASPLCDKLFCAPGNPGIAALAECVNVGAEDIAGIVALAKAEKIEFAIDAAGGLFWNGESVTREDTIARFAAAGLQAPQPEVHLRADQAVPYRFVARTLADASRAGLAKVGFISEPEGARGPPPPLPAPRPAGGGGRAPGAL